MRALGRRNGYAALSGNSDSPSTLPETKMVIILNQAWAGRRLFFRQMRWPNTPIIRVFAYWNRVRVERPKLGSGKPANQENTRLAAAWPRAAIAATMRARCSSLSDQPIARAVSAICHGRFAPHSAQVMPD